MLLNMTQIEIGVGDGKDVYKRQIVHPATIEAGKKWASEQNSPYTIKEAALFFESGSADGMDLIIGVYLSLIHI